MRILSDETEKTVSFRELILQPQSEIQQFRGFLRMQGYLIAEENMIEEDGKFYPIMKAVHCSGDGGGMTDMAGISYKPHIDGNTLTQGESIEAFWQRMDDRYGPILLRQKHPVLYRYLEREARIYEQILEQMRMRGTEEGGRYEEISRQKQDCLAVMKERYGEGYGENYN